MSLISTGRRPHFWRGQSVDYPECILFTHFLHDGAPKCRPSSLYLIRTNEGSPSLYKIGTSKYPATRVEQLRTKQHHHLPKCELVATAEVACGLGGEAWLHNRLFDLHRGREVFFLDGDPVALVRAAMTTFAGLPVEWTVA